MPITPKNQGKQTQPGNSTGSRLPYMAHRDPFKSGAMGYGSGKTWGWLPNILLLVSMKEERPEAGSAPGFLILSMKRGRNY